MTTTALEPELITPALPGFEDMDSVAETAPAQAESVTSGIGAWPAPPTETEAAPESAAPTDAETAPEEAPAPDETQEVRVLIVDDETAMCMMTSAIVKSMGYLPIAVASGEEAIAVFQEHRDRNEAIQAVVMDLALPGGISGLETTDALKEIDPNVKIIASSGYLQQNARSAAIERGFAGILPKPYTAERLTAELRWVVTNRAR